jgi:hypothetical protein
MSVRLVGRFQKGLKWQGTVQQPLSIVPSKKEIRNAVNDVNVQRQTNGTTSISTSFGAMLFCQNRFSWHRLQEPRNVSWYVFPSMTFAENGSPPQHSSLWKDLCLVQEGENQTGKTKGQELLQVLLNLSGSACSPNSWRQRKSTLETPKKTKNYVMRKWIHVCFRGVAHCFQGIGICAASQPESTTPPLRLSRRSYPVNPSEPKDLKVLSQSLQAE